MDGSAKILSPTKVDQQNADNLLDAAIEAETQATCSTNGGTGLETEKKTAAEVTPKILDNMDDLSNDKQEEPLQAAIEAEAACSTDPETDKVSRKRAGQPIPTEIKPELKKKKKSKKSKSNWHDKIMNAERKAYKKKKMEVNASIQEEAEATCFTDPETEKETGDGKRFGDIEIEEDAKKEKLDEIKTQDLADAAPSQGEGETSEKKKKVMFNVPESPEGTPKASAKALRSPILASNLKRA